MPLRSALRRVGVLIRELEEGSVRAREAEDARVWAGLQFRSLLVEATELGLRRGEEAARSRAGR